MSQSTIPTRDAAGFDNSSAIKVLLDIITEKAGKQLDDAERSKALLQLGAKTNMIQAIEDIIADPLNHLSSISHDLDFSALKIIDSIVQSFLISKSNLIQTAYRIKPQIEERALRYVLVLQSDSIETRDEVYDFFEKYDFLEDEKYAVNFYFIKNDKVAKFNNLEKLNMGL